MPFGGMSWALGCENLVRQDLEMTVLSQVGPAFFFRLVSLAMLSAWSFLFLLSQHLLYLF